MDSQTGDFIRPDVDEMPDQPERPTEHSESPVA